MRFATPLPRLLIATLLAALLHAIALHWLTLPASTTPRPALQLTLSTHTDALAPLAPAVNPQPAPTRSAAAHSAVVKAPSKPHPAVVATGSVEHPPVQTTAATNASLPNVANNSVSGTPQAGSTPATNSATASNSTAGAVMVASLSRHASILKRIEPIYPEEARRQNREGLVKVKVQISKDGLPTHVVLMVSSGSPNLDAALQEVILRWRFIPALDAGGQPTEETLVIPYRFQLQKDSSDE